MNDIRAEAEVGELVLLGKWREELCMVMGYKYTFTSEIGTTKELSVGDAYENARISKGAIEYRIASLNDPNRGLFYLNSNQLRGLCTCHQIELPEGWTDFRHCPVCGDVITRHVPNLLIKCEKAIKYWRANPKDWWRCRP